MKRAITPTPGTWRTSSHPADCKAVLLRQLKRVGDQDYFERGIELAIEQDGILIEPVDISTERLLALLAKSGVIPART